MYAGPNVLLAAAVLAAVMSGEATLVTVCVALGDTPAVPVVAAHPPRTAPPRAIERAIPAAILRANFFITNPAFLHYCCPFVCFLFLFLCWHSANRACTLNLHDAGGRLTAKTKALRRLYSCVYNHITEKGRVMQSAGPESQRSLRRQEKDRPGKPVHTMLLRFTPLAWRLT